MRLSLLTLLLLAGCHHHRDTNAAPQYGRTANPNASLAENYRRNEDARHRQMDRAEQQRQRAIEASRPQSKPR